MKRLAFGFLWFVVFLVVGMLVLGIVAAPDTSGYNEAVQSYEAGYAAGHEAGQRYGKIIILGALVLSALGTFLGWLPGTRRRSGS